MNRRGFLSRLFAGTVVATVVPHLPTVETAPAKTSMRVTLPRGSAMMVARQDLQPGDVITTADGTPVGVAAESALPGQLVRVHIRSDISVAV